MRGHPRPEDRARAELLRRQGKTYREIGELLGLSKSTLSNWLADVPLSPEHEAEWRGRAASAADRRAASIRAAGLLREKLVRDAAADEVGVVSARELFLLGVALYWAEGEKAKPWRRSASVRFSNSDPTMIQVWLAWLELLGVSRDDVGFTLCIHESGNIATSTRFWAESVGVEPEQLRVQLKRHRAETTVRRNVGSTYVGLLQVRVHRGTHLGRRIAGWWEGIARSVSGGPACPGTVERHSGVV